MSRIVPEAAVAFVKKFEMYVGRVYDDAAPDRTITANSVVQGTLTAGYGHTGKGVVPGMTVTPQIAEGWLRADLGVAVQRLERLVEPEIIAKLTDAQWAALISFVFNTGGGSVTKPWGIWQVLNAGQFDQVPIRLMQFVNVRIGGQLVKEGGLVARRAAEVALWSVNEPGSVYAPTTSSVTRQVETPPTPLDPVPVTQSKMVMAAAGAVTTALPSVVEHIASLADHASFLASVTAVASIAALGLSAAALWLVLAHKRLSQS